MENDEDNEDNINSYVTSLWDEMMNKMATDIAKKEDEAYLIKLLTACGVSVPVRTFAATGTAEITAIPTKESKEYFISAGTYKVDDGVMIKIDASEDTGETYSRNAFIFQLQNILDAVKGGAALDDVLSDLQDLHDDTIDSDDFDDDFDDEDDDDADACPCAMCKCQPSEEILKYISASVVTKEQLAKACDAILSWPIDPNASVPEGTRYSPATEKYIVTTEWNYEGAASSEDSNETVISSSPKFGGIANKMGY